MVFNPNNASRSDSGIFGLPYGLADSQIVLLPVGWEATTSYRGGTSHGPKIIRAASKQVDLFDLDLGNFYEQGIFMLEEFPEIESMNRVAKKAAQLVIQNDGIAETPEQKAALAEVNLLSSKINAFTKEKTRLLLEQQKIVGLIGGDHSCPFGSIEAYLEKFPDLGVLHFDAHADLRDAYEGFEHSHASIMHNLLHKTKLKKLVQVGIRDFSEFEISEIEKSNGRVTSFFDQSLFEMKAEGKPWKEITAEIISSLPRQVYISFDIDGLDPVLCPRTGTPVPGGLSFHEAVFIIKTVCRSGRTIVGFDLNEVSPGDGEPIDGHDWDANVGARLLYKLCGWTLESQKNALI